MVLLMLKGNRTTLTVFAVITAFLFSTYASSNDDCQQFLGGDEVAHRKNRDVEILLDQNYSLRDLITALDDNLLLGHPYSILNAFQWQTALMDHDGQKTVPSLTNPDEVYIVPRLFTEGLEAADSLRVLSQYKAVHEFYSAIRSMAEGDRSGRSLIVLLGPPGTGKSEFAKIQVHAAKYYARTIEALFKYTFSWNAKALNKIPALARYFSSGIDFPSPLHQSPFVLLPKPFQKAVLEKVQSPVLEQLGFPAAPPSEADPQSVFITQSILEHHAKGSDGSTKVLTNLEIVDALAPYVQVHRFIPATTNPVIPDQGADPDTESLFQMTNPKNLFLSPEGPANPMSNFLSGQLPNANGSLVIFEEAFNNTPKLLKQLQRVIEDRQLSHGGAPDVPLDLVMVAASNDSSLDDKIEQLNAFVDRLQIIRMDWPVRPHDIASILTYMKTGNGVLRGQELLGLEEARNPESTLPESTPLSVDDLYPYPTEFNQMRVGPDRRILLTYGFGDRAIHIAPHTLLHLSLVTAASRMSNDLEEAKKHGNYTVVVEAIFKNLHHRLRAYMGEIELAPEHASELEELRLALKEGRFGISARDAGRWLTRAIDLARRPGNHNTLSPQVIREAFYDQLQEKKIVWPNVETKIKWAQLETSIAKRFMSSRILEDLHVAVGMDTARSIEIAKEILAEILSLQENPNNTTYRAFGSTVPTPIDQDRLSRIRAIHRSEFQADLPEQMMAKLVEGRDPEQIKAVLAEPFHPALIRSIQIDLLENLSNEIPLGFDEAKRRYPQMINIMLKHLGYTEESLRAAIEFVKFQKAFRSATVAE